MSAKPNDDGCLCHVIEPDEFGNRDLDENPDCPIDGSDEREAADRDAIRYGGFGALIEGAAS